MTPHQSLIARSALSTMCSLSAIASVSVPRLRTMASQAFDRLVVLSFVISRLLLYVGIFFLLHLTPRGDVTGYFEEASYVLAGKVPYRDFLCSYAPLHPYLDASLLRLWNDPRIMILFAILAECLLVPLWLRVARGFFREQDVRLAALLYVTSGLSIQFVAVDGQDNVVVALLFALGVWLVARNRAFGSGLVLGLSISLFKFLPLLYVPLYWRATPKWLRWMLGSAVPIAVVYGAALAKRLDITAPLVRESYRTAGCLPYVVEALFGITLSGAFWNAVFLAALLAVLACGVYAMQQASAETRLRLLTLGLAAVTLVILCFPKKSWPPYFLLALFPVCLVLAPLGRFRIAVFAAMQALCVALPSVWADVFVQADAQPMHQLLAMHNTVAIAFVLGEAIMIAGYLWLLWEALRQILQRRASVAAAE